jgi:hypothetical protein
MVRDWKRQTCLVAKLLKSADPARKAAVYAGLGVQLTYRSKTCSVSVERHRAVPKRVGGATQTPSTRDP